MDYEGVSEGEIFSIPARRGGGGVRDAQAAQQARSQPAATIYYRGTFILEARKCTESTPPSSTLKRGKNTMRRSAGRRRS